MLLKDKVSVITGGAQGIGRAIAELFHKEGAKVCICDVDEGRLREVEKEGMKGYKLDVRSLDEVERVFSEIVKDFGGIDILVNNAGITRDNLIIRMSEEEWNLVIDINLKGVFNCSKIASKIMMKKRSGVIVNISSIIGQIGNPGQVNYSASKAGVIGITKTLAKELAGRNIRVNAVAPGFIKTRMTDVLPEDVKNKMLENIPLKRFGEPSDVAELVLFLASDKSSYITGQVVRVDGGMVI
ncbi:MAG: 3-oxoacyl-ACP reductase [Caldiserica bacterium]|nr:MAG: 3-oxoacyl-ACP reductase [Caldisericota bacterium]